MPAPLGLPPSSRRFLRRLHAVLERLTGREDSEHEQALIRIVIICGMFAFMAWAPWPEAERAWIVQASAVVFGIAFLVSVGLFLHILHDPRPNPIRRVAGIVLDAAGLNVAMYLGGTLTTPFYPLLLWIIFGHGFRYGRYYLYLAAILSLVGFLIVVAESEDWRRYPVLAASLVLALIVLPAYVSVLLAKLEDALERAKAASRAKSRFLATMSHEFRTPLNAIVGSVELLDRTRLDRDQRDLVATVRTAASSLLSLVNSVLDLARIESGRMELEREAFDLDRELAVLRTMLTPTAAGKGLWLRLRLDPAVPPRVVGSRRALHQVLVNLVANAIKFTERGGVTVRVLHRGQRLRFEVEDTGIGISEEAQRRIFERFAQADEHTRERYGGSGLGLAISRELVGLMGGTIGVVSRLGEGSRFWFEVPLEPAEKVADEAHLDGTVAVIGEPTRGLALVERLEAHGLAARVSVDVGGVLETVRRARGRVAVLAIAADPPVDLTALREALDRLALPEPLDIVGYGLEVGAAAPLLGVVAEGDEAGLRRLLRAALVAAEAGEPARAGGHAVGGCHILLAEDNPVNQKVVGRLLEQAGHRVTTVADGHGVLEALERERFDLVLMDINMPELSGPEAVKMLRFMYDPAELPPLVALSADATAETRERCLALGFTRYLTKPVDVDLLLATVEELVPPERRSGSAVAVMDEGQAQGGGDGRAPSAGAVVIPHPRAQEEGAVLDESRLRALAGLDQGDGFLRETVEAFLADGEVLVAAMRQAAAAGDVRTYRDRAHALRSSAAHIGAMALYRRCLEWRELDDHALAMRMRHEVEGVAAAFAQARQALLAFLARREPPSHPRAAPGR